MPDKLKHDKQANLLKAKRLLELANEVPSCGIEVMHIMQRHDGTGVKALYVYDNDGWRENFRVALVLADSAAVELFDANGEAIEEPTPAWLQKNGWEYVCGDERDMVLYAKGDYAISVNGPEFDEYVPPAMYVVER